MSSLSDTAITNWQDNYTGSDTNSPAGSDSMAGTLDDQLRNIKSVVRLESENKAWFRVLGLSSMPSASAPTYGSATSFTLPGNWTTLTGQISVNQRIKAAVTAGTVFGYISAMSFAANTTTFTVVMDGSSALDSGLTEVQFSAITDTSGALPASVVKSGSTNPLYCVITNGGSGAAFTGTLVPAITSYSQGQPYALKWAQASQGSDTVNLNGIGAVTVKKIYGQTGSFNLAASDIPAGTITTVYYDGTNWEIWLPNGEDAQTVGGGTAGQVLTVNDAGTKIAAQTPAHGMQLFTTSGTFTVPAGVYSVRFQAWGGGGGGGSYGASHGNGGNGGNTTVVGAGTTGSTLTANGGSGSLGAAGSSTGAGGAGGGASNGTLNVVGNSGSAGVNYDIAAGGGFGGLSLGRSYGGGGNGGGPGNGSAGAGGGGAGGFADNVTATTPASTFAVTIGAAGAAGSGTDNGSAGLAGAVLVTW